MHLTQESLMRTLFLSFLLVSCAPSTSVDSSYGSLSPDEVSVAVDEYLERRSETKDVSNPCEHPQSEEWLKELLLEVQVAIEETPEAFIKHEVKDDPFSERSDIWVSVHRFGQYSTFLFSGVDGDTCQSVNIWFDEDHFCDWKEMTPCRSLEDSDFDGCVDFAIDSHYSSFQQRYFYHQPDDGGPPIFSGMNWWHSSYTNALGALSHHLYHSRE